MFPEENKIFNEKTYINDFILIMEPVNDESVFILSLNSIKYTRKRIETRIK